ncbi:sugar kinase [Cytobacillus oceanisediminis]|uniref:FGGY-family carbohydrate kinase n=1 Tax=Cytobacillus oceanisediminis TaxID=665099 RepID=UPI001D158FDD|nr:FGGY family carbohydrate kinase [Cytobacillus oceanisediminis]MCC3648497.1 sugar kinase [Cytobacillus oceanisediminis]
MNRYVMGIDNGSQSTKVAIYDFEGNEVAFGSYQLKETLSPEPGVVIHPDDDLWDSVNGAIKNCLANFTGNPKEIAGIGLCTIRCCRVLLKEDGHLAYPVISWMDSRLSRPYVHSDDQVKYVTTTSGYLGFRLTGEFTDSASNYEIHWPLNRETLDWSQDKEYFKSCGLTRDMVFDLVKPGEELGTLRKELADLYGMKPGIPVVATANDKAVEALGSGIKDDETIMISLGTFISSMLLRNDYKENAVNFFPTLACIPFKYVYESKGIRRGMWTVSWFKKLIGEELVIEAAKLGVTEEEYMNRKAQEVPVGSDGLITILDWLSTPSEPYRKGIMMGFDQRHTKFHIYRSILEAISFNIKNNIDEMLAEIDVTLKDAVVIGGGSKSDLMMQIIADLFGMPVHRREGNSSACLGAAICVCKHLAIYSDFYEAADKMVKTSKTFVPNPENNVLYNNVNETIVKQVRKHTDEILKLTYPIFS